MSKIYSLLIRNEQWSCILECLTFGSHCCTANHMSIFNPKIELAKDFFFILLLMTWISWVRSKIIKTWFSTHDQVNSSATKKYDAVSIFWSDIFNWLCSKSEVILMYLLIVAITIWQGKKKKLCRQKIGWSGGAFLIASLALGVSVWIIGDIFLVETKQTKNEAWTNKFSQMIST